MLPRLAHAVLLSVALGACSVAHAQEAPGPAADDIEAEALDVAVAAVMPELIAWRRDIHQYPKLGTLEVLVGMKGKLGGEVMFVFQPAEGPPVPGQIVGAKAMLDDGLFAEWNPDAVYGLHVWAALPAGTVGYRSGPTMASVDEWNLVIRGRQTHGARPWDGIDPITVAVQVQMAMLAIVARQVDIVRTAVVLSTGLRSLLVVALDALESPP